MTAISELKRGALTKAQQETFSTALINEIIEGNANVLEVELYLKSMEKTIETVRNNATVKEMLLNEASKYGTKEFEAFGAKITLTGKQSFDYSTCGSSEWNSLDAEIKYLTEKKKALENTFKTLQTSISTTDGEIINPPSVSRIEFLTIKF